MTMLSGIVSVIDSPNIKHHLEYLCPLQERTILRAVQSGDGMFLSKFDAKSVMAFSAVTLQHEVRSPLAGGANLILASLDDFD